MRLGPLSYFKSQQMSSPSRGLPYSLLNTYSSAWHGANAQRTFVEWMTEEQIPRKRRIREKIRGHIGQNPKELKWPVRGKDD